MSYRAPIKAVKRDQRKFKTTAASTKKINCNPKMMRGGTRL